MISEKTLREELKRLPKLIRQCIKEGHIGEALETQNIMETIEWVLSDEE